MSPEGVVTDLESVASLDTVFAPVRSQTAFEETVDRLGTAIRLGLLPPGTRLPAERELCAKLGIARSTLRQALRRARAERAPARDPRPRRRDVRRRSAAADGAALARSCSVAWREDCDERMAVEVGVAVLAAERAEPAMLRRARRARGWRLDGMLRGLRLLPPGRRALPRRARRGDRQPAAGGGDDRGAGRDDAG